VFLFFVSPSSIVSEHCRRELNYALETHRRIVAVHLEATELSPGQKMSLMDRQAILRYQLTEDEYQRKLTVGVLNEPLAESPQPATRPRRTSPARRTLMYAGIPALLAVIIWGWFQLSFDSPTPLEDAPATPAGDPALAVMPFQAISGEQAVADGFHADVMDRLTRLPGVLLISIDSLNVMQRREASTTEIAGTLNVSHVVQGDVQQIGEQLRINLKLIDGQSGTVVWSERYDRSGSDLFSVQTDIANRMARSLDVELNASQGAVVAAIPTTSPEAWGLYQQARRDFRNRPALLEQALELDPDFADAMSLLAYTRARMNDFSDENIALARRAVEINPDRTNYLITLAMTLSLRFPVESRSQFEAARALGSLDSPREYASAVFWINGFLDLSLDMFDLQRRLDPLNPSSTHVRALIAGREFEQAVQIATLWEDVWGERSRISLHAEIFAAQNRIAEAIETVHQFPPDDWAVVRDKAWLLNAIGLKSEALQYMSSVSIPTHIAGGLLPILRDLDRLEDVDPTHLGDVQRLYLQTDRVIAQYSDGDREDALEGMNRLLKAVATVLDEVEVRYGNDHVPGYLFRVDAPLGYPLMARLTGNDELVARMTRKVRFTLANGGTFEIPKREHLLLMMLAALEQDQDEAIRQLDLARQHGLRNLTMLDFYGLRDDRFGIYGGLTDNPQYQSLLSAIASSNQATITTLRTRLPELFTD